MYYARQIPEERQESPFWLSNITRNGAIENREEYPGIALKSSNNLVELNPSVVDKVISAVSDIEDCYAEIKHFGKDFGGHKTLTECIAKLVGRRPSTKAVYEWKQLVDNFNDQDDDLICKALTLFYGVKWDHTELHGCAQGDFITAFYMSDIWNRKALEEIESEYFNLGTEWRISEMDEEPESPENIDGEYVYICDYDHVRGLKDEFGDDIVIYECDGGNYSYSYSRVS